MSLLLGIYNKKNITDNAFTEKLLNTFTLNGKRQYKTITTGSLVLYLSENDNNYHLFSTADYLVAFSGRIYSADNSQTQVVTLNQNSCENIYESYCQKGTKVFKDLDGEYTCLITDSKQNKTYIANDYWGLYPLYYTDADDYFVFCNEYEPLTAINNLKESYNALAEYFTLGAVLGDKTFFENINSLPPNSFIELNNNKLKISSPLKNIIAINRNITINEAVEHIAFLFKKGLQKRVDFFQYNFDAMLTGGADTRLILSCLNNEQRQKIKFVSYLTPPLKPTEDADVFIAQKIASKLHLNHEIRTFDLWDKPFDESYFNFKRNISDQKYLSGHFGSELLKYEMYKATDAQLLKAVAANDSFFSKIEFRFNIKKELRCIFSKDVLISIDNPFDTLKTEIDKNSFCENKKRMLLFNTITRSFFTRTWRGTQSVYFDQPAYMPIIFIMPFLDRNLLSFLFTLPEDFFGINHNNIYNLLFKNHFPELLAIETNSPLANDPLSVFNKETSLGDPFNYRNYNYDEAMSKTMLEKKSLTKYNKSFLKRINEPVNIEFKQRLIDFETWNRYISTR